MVVVRTKEELLKEVKRCAYEITIEGELANDIHEITSKKDKYFLPPYLTIGCISLEIILKFIMILFTLGLAFYAIYNKYEEIYFSLGPPPVVRIRRKANYKQ